MTTAHGDFSSSTQIRGGFVLAAVFTCSIFLSACLLFFVQPMFTKMALPYLGGAPNVWNTAMVFFQAMLLGGYIYAHVISKYLPIPAQLGVHALVLLAGLIFLPIAIGTGVTPTIEAPAIWLIGLFAAALGVPFFALSAHAPLLQRWFSYTDHPNASDPYFMYAASNLGSLLVLCAYPVIIEPLIGLSAQSAYWKIGYLLLIAFVIGSGVLAYTNRSKITAASEKAEEAPAETISWTRRAQWVAIAFVPSSLMLGATSHLSANVAAAPFIWVGPLALYLLTFVVGFSTTPAIRPQLISFIAPIAVILSLVFTALHVEEFVLAIGTVLVLFYIVAQYCHNHLASLRPSVSHLTEFYLAMSLGGVLGGAFTALIAPIAFNNVHEYPMMIIASVLVGGGAIAWRSKAKEMAIAFAVGIGPILLTAWIFNVAGLSEKVAAPLLNVAIFGAAFGLYRMRKNAAVFAIGLVGFAVGLSNAYDTLKADGSVTRLYQERSFFGVIRVEQHKSDIGTYNSFIHGDTEHNKQLRVDEYRQEPLAYFSKGGPYDQALSALRADRNGDKLNLAVIGLGAGALACYAQEGEVWTYYEIDPAIAAMARNDELFSYMNDCQSGAPVKLGDARLMIADEKEGSFDMIVVDAFSSDAVPAHLITREALALYRTKLESDGFIFFHTSNRIVDVTSVATALANDAGLSARAIRYAPKADDPWVKLRNPTHAVIVAEEARLDELLAGYDDWKTVTPHPMINAWTDDYSHIIGAIIAQSRGGAKLSE